MASGEDGDEYSRFLYMLLVEDESLLAMNHKFCCELLEKYPMYELDESYILNMRASAESRHHMVGFHMYAEHTDADSNRIDYNQACVFPILKNCSAFCPNCVDDESDGDDDDIVLALDMSDDESNYEDEEE